MSERRKRRNVSLLLGVLMVLGLGGYLAAIIRNGTMSGGMLLIALLLAVLSAAAIYGTYQKTRTTEEERKLEGRYLTLYERVEAVLATENLSGADRRDIKGEWLDMLTTAQAEGKDPEALYGKDFESAMQVWLAAYRRPRKGWGNLMDGVMFYCLFLVFMQVLNYSQDPGQGFFGVATPNNILLYLGLVAFVILPLSRFFQRRGQYVRLLGVPVGIFAGYVTVTELTDRMAGETWWAQWYIEGETLAIPNPAILIILIALAAVILAIRIRMRRVA